MTMLADLTAMQLYCLQIGRLAEAGRLTPTVAGLAKMHNPARPARSPLTRGTCSAATASCSTTRSCGTWWTWKGGPDDPAGAQDPGGLHRQLARRAACPQDQDRLTGLEVTAVVQRHPSDHPGHPEGGGEAGSRPAGTGNPARIGDRHQLGQRAVRGGRACQVAAGAVAELHDRLVARDVGGWSRRSENWSFTIAISSGFKAAATKVPADRPWAGCGSANWSRAGWRRIGE